METHLHETCMILLSTFFCFLSPLPLSINLSLTHPFNFFLLLSPFPSQLLNTSYSSSASLSFSSSWCSLPLLSHPPSPPPSPLLHPLSFPRFFSRSVRQRRPVSSFFKTFLPLLSSHLPRLPKSTHHTQGRHRNTHTHVQSHLTHAQRCTTKLTHIYPHTQTYTHTHTHKHTHTHLYISYMSKEFLSHSNMQIADQSHFFFLFLFFILLLLSIFPHPSFFYIGIIGTNSADLVVIPTPSICNASAAIIFFPSPSPSK